MLKYPHGFLPVWKIFFDRCVHSFLIVSAGVGFATRQVGNRTKPNLVVSVDDQGTVCMKSQSTFKNTEIKFKLNEPFEETTADDRKTRVSAKACWPRTHHGLRWFAVRGTHGLSLFCCPPADRGDSGKRQACAETELGRQRNLYRKGDLGRQIDSGKTL